MEQAHNSEKLISYIYNELSPNEMTAIEEHLSTCRRCREFLTFAREFHAQLTKIDLRTPEKEVCPDVSLIVALVEGTLDKRTAQHVRAHLLHCTDCMEEFHA